MSLHFLHAFADPEIASRACYALLGAAAAGAFVLVVRAALPRQAPTRALILPAVQGGFVYLCIGLGSRFVIQHHRSRLQILLLLGAVAFAELLRYRRGEAGLRLATWFTGSVAVCLGVVAAKWALEPGALSDALGRLRSVGGDA